MPDATAGRDALRDAALVAIAEWIRTFYGHEDVPVDDVPGAVMAALEQAGYIVVRAALAADRAEQGEMFPPPDFSVQDVLEPDDDPAPSPEDGAHRDTLRRAVQGYVVGFLVDPYNDEVLLVRKNRPQWQAGLLNGIGGHIEPGETPDAAMEREFEEEAGLRVGPWERITTMAFPGAYIVFFRCRPGGVSVLLGEAQTTTDEPIERHSITALLAPGAPIIPNLRWLLPLAAYQADDYEPFSVRAQVAEVLPQHRQAVSDGGWAPALAADPVPGEDTDEAQR